MLGLEIVTDTGSIILGLRNETGRLLLWNLDWEIDIGGLDLGLGLGSGNTDWVLELNAGIGAGV